MYVKPKKALGQHFLTDESIAADIADTIADEKDLPILEIGPGTGVLTKYLLRTGRELKAVEIDSESVAYLAINYPQLQVIEGDFLRLNVADIFGSPFALIGNYPYNISSQIFFKVLDNIDTIPVVAGMLQKEVAERICAAPGSKVYGILSVLLQTWYDCKYLFNVPPHVFSPPPKVMSGVIRLTRNERTELPCSPKLYKSIIKTAFGQRRKTLRNSLASFLPKGAQLLSDPIMTRRPETLSVEEFIFLTQQIQENS